MNTAHCAASRRTGFGRSGVRRLIIVLAVPVALLAAGCGGGSTGAGQSSKDVVAKLGAVPIPIAPATQPTPSADESHPQLVAIGSAVSVTLPGGTGVITALGPTEDLPTPAPAKPPSQVSGTITLRVAPASGTLTVRAADLSSRDDHGNNITLTAVGPNQVIATAGTNAPLTVRGTFQSGAAQITLRQDGHAIAVWDFNIELD